MTLRLAKSFLALALAASMAVFPIGIQRAVAAVGHDHAAAVPHSDEPYHTGTGSQGCEDGRGSQTVADTCAHAHDPASHDNDDAACCGSIVCHGFGISAAPSLSVPVAYGVKRASVRDQQTARVFSARLDRPPRTS